MFGNNKSKVEMLESRVKDLLDQNRTQRVAHDLELQQLHQERELAIMALRSEHELTLKQKAFEMSHLADERVKKAEDDKAKLQETVAVLSKEKEMLERVINMEADIVDVKELVNKLISKLPEVNLKNLTINTNGNNNTA